MGERDGRTQKEVNEEFQKKLDFLGEHYTIWNEEFGVIKTNVAWLIWAVKLLIAGIGTTIMGIVTDIVLRLIHIGI